MTTNEKAVDLARALIRMPTVNPPGDERDCARFLGTLLERAGFTVDYYEFAERRTSLVARCGCGDGRPVICFTGHIDTVPLGSIPWQVDPHGGEIRDGRLYGRGASDMKSGVAAFVAAAIALADILRKGPGVVLVITAGEETGCQGAYHLVEREDVLGKMGAVVVGEPTSNYPLVAHKGALWLKAVTRGVATHGSMPEAGVNAIYRAARMVGKLSNFSFNQSPHEILGVPTLNVGTIVGGKNINSVPDFAEIGIDIRTTPGMDGTALEEWLGGYLAPEIDDLTTVAKLEPVLTESTNPWIRSIFDTVASVTRERPEASGASYFTDACAFRSADKAVPIVILGPGEPQMAHQTDEYCKISRIRQAVDIYSAVMQQWQGI